MQSDIANETDDRNVQGLTRRIAELELLLAQHGIRIQSSLDEVRLALAFEHGPLGIYLFDDHLHIIKANRSYCQMIGLSEPEVIGLKASEMTHPNDREVEEAVIRRLASGFECKATYSKRLLRPNGALVWVDMTLARISGHDAETLYGVAMIENITARRQAEESLKQRENELAHFARLSVMGEMVAGLAHELNQPLTAIANLAHASIRSLVARRTEGADDIRSWLDTIAGQATRAGDMIRRLRRFVKKSDIQQGPIDVCLLIDDVLALLAFEARHLSIKIETKFASGMPRIIGDKVQIQQVIVNVLRNSFDSLKTAPSAERRIAVETSPVPPGEVAIVIEDNGVGVPAEVEGQVFEPFFSTKKDAVGMGLTISRIIVEGHGGRIKFISYPQSGATVRIDLPVGGKDSR